jgi:phosphomevalonate kinase
MSVTARAPGKLFLTGEWAVLRGAPALVAAVDREASVTIAPAAAGVTVVSRAEDRTDRLDTLDPETRPSGDAAAVRAVLATAGGAARPLHVIVDSEAFMAGDRKLGLGRSAATIVATVAALAPDAGRDAWLATALRANARLQGGHGSGGDIASAVYGGLIEVRREGEGLRVQPRQLPAGLHLVAGWTGTSAHTPPLLARFSAAEPPAALAELARVAVRAAEAVERGDRDTLLDAVDRSAALLTQLGASLDLPIVTPALATLVRTANRAGAAAKPSGAGGGDCGIAFATSQRQAAAVRAAWEDAGILPLEIALAPEGVVVG